MIVCSLVWPQRKQYFKRAIPAKTLLTPLLCPNHSTIDGCPRCHYNSSIKMRRINQENMVGPRLSFVYSIFISSGQSGLVGIETRLFWASLVIISHWQTITTCATGHFSSHLATTLVGQQWPYCLLYILYHLTSSQSIFARSPFYTVPFPLINRNRVSLIRAMYLFSCHVLTGSWVKICI